MARVLLNISRFSSVSDTKVPCHHGYSLKLEGLEKGINDNALERSIVMHGASYVSEGMIKIKGYLGRSWGCPAVPEKYSKPIIDKIKNGSCMFIYANNSKYFEQSKILQS